MTQTLAEQFAQSLQSKLTPIFKERYPNLTPETFEVMHGARFDRIVQISSSGQRAVHAFVERSTGKLVKPAGWKAPAKRSNGELQSKFNLSTPHGFALALDAADLYGSYLYA